MNSDVTAQVTLTEEEFEAIATYWISVGEDQDGRTPDERARDRGFAVQRLRYWDTVCAQAFPGAETSTADEWAARWGVTREAEAGAALPTRLFTGEAQ